MFEKQGLITIEIDAIDEDTLIELAMEAGAEDIKSESGVYEVITQPADVDTVRSAIEAKGIPMVSAEVTMIPKDSVKLEKESQASSMMKLYDILEDLDDVQKIYANFDISEELLEKLSE
jgi:transcriptional/translational regulatory protein YebC/TACO1